MPVDHRRARAARLRRESPYGADHRRSKARAWDGSTRQPRDLREAVYLARRAYRDEVPGRLTEGYESVGDDGNPRFAPEATHYIFGSPDHLEKPTPGDAIAYRTAPFRSAVASFERGDDLNRHRAAIVRRVTIGNQHPIEAAIAEGAAPWSATVVAFDALAIVLASVSDIVVVR